MADFPIDVSGYRPLSFTFEEAELSNAKKKHLEENIALFRDLIIFYTAIAAGKGLSGHTGGPYNIVPEVLIAEGFMRGTGKVVPIAFDEAGHRVAIQYALAAMNGEMPMEKLYHYRAAGEGLYGHPELDKSLGIKFSSGRLGHMFPYVNGVARANPDKHVVLFGSDGSQQEGNDAEAARHAVAHNLKVSLLIDDNNVTIAGYPKEYLPGFDLARTLGGHGLRVDSGEGENWESLYTRIHGALTHDGPSALVNTRVMAPGIPELEGKHTAHDVVPVDAAVAYLEKRGQKKAADYLKGVEKPKADLSYVGVSEDKGSNRKTFGAVVNEILDEMPEKERVEKVMVIDSDLEGSTGLNTIGKEHPEVYTKGGVMERGNFSVAAGFGFEGGKQGVFSTFSAFLEMILSELTMARLNESNVLCHFSHAGVDYMADNTCHYGTNIFFADNGPVNFPKKTRLYFPADPNQLRALVKKVFHDEGIRFVFSTRSTVPYVLKDDGSKVYDENYSFTPGKDDVIREGGAGYVVTYGELLYRSVDAVDRLRKEGIDVGLINKPTLNVVDEDTIRKIGETGFVLVVESQHFQTGLGSKFGTWLLERGLTPTYRHLGVTEPGHGGLEEHVFHHGIDSGSIQKAVRELTG
ncbi:MAG: transketolase [Spirochaetes bacterium]|jgi:transketolase C-terminal domain/subunit/transketolase N-terminal domain/subunit|nr:transketolase [Spirochaetota bacterium]